MSWLNKILGDPNKKALKELKPIVARVSSLEPECEKLGDEELRAKTDEFKGRLAKGESLDDLMPEAFAVVREAAKRVLNERAFDTQVMGGVVLHQGKITEMRTGEGKTLAATMPVYLNALTGKGVHVITVNDYLAKRDSEWMGKIYEFLGLTASAITNDLPADQRQAAYAADVTYGTNNEFGFDYLRDNMAQTAESQVQRKLNYAIVDEVDSILIDEARTPLIISAPAEESTEHYKRFAAIVPQLTANVDYTIDEKMRSAILTDAGIDKIQKLLGIDDIYESGNMLLAHHIEQALRAQTLYKKDVDYVIKDGEIVIVDEFTGRLMSGRRYSEGLHQAIEAKEKVEIKRESKTFATITFQNYFRIYDKLSGMTGTAKTEEEEFWKIYGLEVVVLPTNKPMIRDDMNDLVYINEKAKFNATVNEVKERHAKGQPILVGTIAIEKSELLSAMLKQEGVAHNVLNAKHHDREAEIVKDAGQKGTVTIATNMAGRGTDIKLGEGVRELGGLHIIGTERHESRRIDNQLRGRTGRQGDPGSSQFFVSMEDDLMRLFGSDRMKNMMKTLKIPEDQPLEHKWISGSIESAQKRVEGHNFDIRKRVVEYDDVMNRHRATIYKQRQSLLENEDAKDTILSYIEGEVAGIVSNYMPEDTKLWDKKKLVDTMQTVFPLREDLQKVVASNDSRDEIIAKLTEEAHRLYENKEKEAGEETFRQVERAVILRVMDLLWMEHLDAMVRLREAIGLRGYGQRDPLVEYKQEAYGMFQRLQGAIASDVSRMIYRVKVTSVEEREKVRRAEAEKRQLAEKGAEEPKGDFKDEKKDLKRSEKPRSTEGNDLGSPSSASSESAGSVPRDVADDSKAKQPQAPAPSEKKEATPSVGAMPGSVVRDPSEKKEKVGRNDPCPCGATDESGKPIKYKKCCGKNK